MTVMCPLRPVSCTCTLCDPCAALCAAPCTCVSCATLCPPLCYPQAAADGSLVLLVQKLRSQPQILTAFARDAPLRQPDTVARLVEALQQLQVWGLCGVSGVNKTASFGS